MQVVRETLYLGPAFRGLNSEHQRLNSNLGGWWRGGEVILPPCWFSLDNPETVKAVTLAFCSIQ